MGDGIVFGSTLITPVLYRNVCAQSQERVKRALKSDVGISSVLQGSYNVYNGRGCGVLILISTLEDM